MKKSKIFLSIILVVVAAFALTACGTLDFTYVQNSDGTYTHIVKVTLTEEGVKSADVGLTLDEAVNALKEGFMSGEIPQKLIECQPAADKGLRSAKRLKINSTI